MPWITDATVWIREQRRAWISVQWPPGFSDACNHPIPDSCLDVKLPCYVNTYNKETYPDSIPLVHRPRAGE